MEWQVFYDPLDIPYILGGNVSGEGGGNHWIIEENKCTPLKKSNIAISRDVDMLYSIQPFMQINQIKSLTSHIQV